MFALLLSLLFSVITAVACMSAQVSTGTAVFFGILALIVSYYLIGWVVRKRVTGVQKQLQEVIQSGQQRISRIIHQAQTKPGANIKVLQRQVDGEQKQVYQRALDFTKNFEPYRKWGLLMGRQIATMRYQFLYQLKEFDQVDALLASRGLLRGPLLMEPTAVAMKMARHYKNGEIAAAEKTFKRHSKWFRGDRSTLLYGLMSWIYIKEGDAEKARELLLKGKESTGDETLIANWEKLSNNKVKSFSNAGLGEEWYALYLENPPAPKQQRARGNPYKGRRF